ncbi:MAG: prolyl oligopeptidase family serine peptidase [Candidatus Andersenbacteria bacterium]
MNRKKRKTAVQISIAVVLIAALLVLLLPGRRIFVSTAVTINVLIPNGDWRPLERFTSAPTWHDIATQTADGQDIVVRIYEPSNTAEETPAQFGLVIYTPLIAAGLDDERLMNLASSWARAGIPVAIPWSDNGLAIQVRDIEEIVAAAQQLQTQTNITKLVLFGISYGNGPTFHAAIDERLANSLAAIISLNGMYDLASVVEFIDSGQSHEYGREVVAATRAAGIDLADVRDRLSPATALNQITVPVYSIHSTADQFIPHTQSTQLHQSLLSQHKESTLVLTDVIEHGTYRPLTPTNFFTRYIPAGWGLTRISYALLALR